ncbi:MAG: glutamyl-tRNA reductase [Verrucomicrobiota bacterium]|nr:glutamyl-tRNA reductase [Verrucomicrobiota bacterium]
MPVTITGLSHHSSPVELRERFAFTEAQIIDALYQIRKKGIAEEAMILSTCNRVEIYAVSKNNNKAFSQELSQFLCEFHDISENPGDALYSFNESHSIDHLFRVSCGIDSMVLGETEILGQLKQSYKLALEQKATGPILNKIFQKAFNVAKLVRTKTQIQRGSISVSSVAVELAESIFDSLESQQVLVIGAGDTSEKAARALKSRGARSILVSNRSHEKATSLAEELHGRAINFDTWEQEFKTIDIIISSTSAPHYVLKRDKLQTMLKQRGNSPLLIIDIAVPRDIDPDCNQVENVYVYNIDDLQTIASQYLNQRKADLANCEKLIINKRDEILIDLKSYHRKPSLILNKQQTTS